MRSAAYNELLPARSIFVEPFGSGHKILELDDHSTMSGGPNQRLSMQARSSDQSLLMLLSDWFNFGHKIAYGGNPFWSAFSAVVSIESGLLVS